jgi:uncharacterized cupin superfamily protein
MDAIAAVKAGTDGACYILSGRVTIIDSATGECYGASAGGVIVQPRGWSGRWDVTETIRKVYAIGVPAADR